MSPLIRNLSGAAFALALVLFGLAITKRSAAPSGAPSVEPSTSSARPVRERYPAGPARGPRELIPKTAWLVVDFDPRLADRAPFEDSPEVRCRTVRAPERAVVAILPPKNLNAEPSVVLAATQVDSGFFACARARILASGGAEAPLAPGLDLLRSKNGFLLHEQSARSLLFATGEPDTELLVKALLGLPIEVPAEQAGEHAAGPSGTLGYLTLSLPRDWLNAAGQDAARSPLRHARGGSASLLPTGSITATLDCDPVGCGELRKFAELGLSDLSRRGKWGNIQAKWSEEPGKIVVSLNIRRGLQGILGSFLSGPLSAQ